AHALCLLRRHPPGPTLFPYTTLFRSRCRQIGDVDADHRFAQSTRHLGDDLRVVVERGRLDDRLRTGDRIAGLEDARAHEDAVSRSEEHTSELQSRENLVCRLLLEKKK